MGLPFSKLAVVCGVWGINCGFYLWVSYVGTVFGYAYQMENIGVGLHKLEREPHEKICEGTGSSLYNMGQYQMF